MCVSLSMCILKKRHQCISLVTFSSGHKSYWVVIIQSIYMSVNDFLKFSYFQYSHDWGSYLYLVSNRPCAMISVCDFQSRNFPLKEQNLIRCFIYELSCIFFFLTIFNLKFPCLYIYHRKCKPTGAGPCLPQKPVCHPTTSSGHETLPPIPPGDASPSYHRPLSQLQYGECSQGNLHMGINAHVCVCVCTQTVSGICCCRILLNRRQSWYSIVVLVFCFLSDDKW